MHSALALNSSCVKTSVTPSLGPMHQHKFNLPVIVEDEEASASWSMRELIEIEA